MRVKVGTSLDRELLARAQGAAVRRGKKLNEMLEEALIAYLDADERTTHVDLVTRTWGTSRIDEHALRQVLDEDVYDA